MAHLGNSPPATGKKESSPPARTSRPGASTPSSFDNRRQGSRSFWSDEADEEPARNDAEPGLEPGLEPGSPTVEASEPYWGKPLVEDLPRHDGTFVPSPRLEAVERRISH